VWFCRDQNPDFYLHTLQGGATLSKIVLNSLLRLWCLWLSALKDHNSIRTVFELQTETEHLVFNTKNKTVCAWISHHSLDVCPSTHPYVHQYVRPSTESFSDSNEIWCVGRGRWVMHDGVPYGPIHGQGQVHVALTVRNSSIFKISLLHHCQWELASDCWFFN